MEQSAFGSNAVTPERSNFYERLLDHQLKEEELDRNYYSEGVDEAEARAIIERAAVHPEITVIIRKLTKEEIEVIITHPEGPAILILRDKETMESIKAMDNSPRISRVREIIRAEKAKNYEPD